MRRMLLLGLIALMCVPHAGCDQALDTTVAIVDRGELLGLLYLFASHLEQGFTDREAGALSMRVLALRQRDCIRKTYMDVQMGDTTYPYLELWLRPVEDGLWRVAIEPGLDDASVDELRQRLVELIPPRLRAP